MKLVVIAGGALVASILGACAASSRNTAEPDRAAQQAEADKAAAQEAARKAQNDAAREQAEAQEAKRAQHTAEQQAQWASERAALAEAQAAHEAKTPAGGATHVTATGTTERQADTTRAADTTAGIPPKTEVFFNGNSTDLSADAKAKLNQLAQSLKVQPQAHDVLVQGYTDDSGPESTNVQLSEKRAEVVVDYLANRGVPRDRVASKSLGSQHAANHDGTERGRALNRRVEILIRPIAKR